MNLVYRQIVNRIRNICQSILPAAVVICGCLVIQYPAFGG
jgi:hypothetical protein